ncbi:MAG: DUF4410 domain-containing protein [Verrucomicrobiota bacterium]|nr:DUF4410 domain-containing protein [Verrucomicrobiota bacterium]
MTLRFLFLLAACLAAFGCASQEQRTAESSRPRVIYIKDFNTSEWPWEVGLSGQKLAEYKKVHQKALSHYLTDTLGKSVSTAQYPGLRPKEGWVVTGVFTSVRSGNRALRAVSMGNAGESSVRTLVRVYNLNVLADEPLFSFDTHQSSQNAAVTLNSDIKHTSQEIASKLKNYLEKVK